MYHHNKDMKTLDTALFKTLITGLEIVGEVSVEGAFIQSLSGKTVLELNYDPEDEFEIQLYRLDGLFELCLSDNQTKTIMDYAYDLYEGEMNNKIEAIKSYECPSLTHTYY